jgi:mRNA interferase MazF
MLKKGEVKSGDIIWTQFNPSVGHEFQDKRPALVIQSNRQLAKSNLATVMPITASVSKKRDDDIIIEPNIKNNLRCASVIKVYDIISCDYQRFFGKIGVIEEGVMDKIKEYLKRHFGI